ncbi:MAG: hypothetical protein WDZ46_10560 [Solirubrobacterales bacterium]
MAALLALPGSAEAGKTADGFVGTSQSTYTGLGGQLLAAREIAVNDPTVNDSNPAAEGDVYVIQDFHRIERLNADGSFVSAWGKDVVQPGKLGDTGTGYEVCTVAAECKPAEEGSGPGELRSAAGIAIDQSDGSVYVWDRLNARVQKYDAEGNFLLAFGSQVNETTGEDVCTAASGDECSAGTPGSGAGQFAEYTVAAISAEWGSPAVNPLDGHLFVPDGRNRRLAEYTPEGEFVRAFGWGIDSGAEAFESCTAASGCQAGSTEAGEENGRFGRSSPQHVGVEPNGVVYASDFTRTRLIRIDSTKASAAEALRPPLLAQVDGGPLYTGKLNDSGDSATRGIEFDPATGHMFVARHREDVEGVRQETLVQEIDVETDTEVAASPHGVGMSFDAGTHAATSTTGIALNPQSGALYVAHPAKSPQDGGSMHGYFLLDDDGAAPPIATAQPPTEVSAHGATLQGTVEPEGAAFYKLQYAKSGSGAWQDASPYRLATGSGAVAVAEQVEGLEANASYDVRIVLAKPTDSIGGALKAQSAPLAFLTPEVPPEAQTGPVQQRSDTSAYLTATINANNLPTTYRFEWGETSEYGNSVPVPDGLLEGGQPQLVGERLSGLEPETTYHYRIVAENAKGEAEPQGEDRTFITREAVASPPGRAYEMVTPPDKVNRRATAPSPRPDLINNPGLASHDGEAVMFGFFAGILDPEQGAGFPHADDRVVIRRNAGEGRWLARAVNDIPAAINSATGIPLLGTNGVSADFNVQVWWHKKALFPTNSILSTKVMSDIGSSGYLNSGWYDWIGDEGLAELVLPYPNVERGLVDDEGERLLRSYPYYRGLLGSGDPSLKQLPPGCGPQGDPCEFSGGHALYVQEPPGVGPRHLVSECTEKGGPTQVPARLASGDIGEQACGEGSPTSARGAIGGAEGYWLKAMSGDGKRIFFTSPDPGAAPSSCATATGAATDCPPQLFVRQYDGSAPGTHGAATVRWISRSQTSGAQHASLLREVHFEGSSEDGHYAFFRTDAPLTDDDPNGGSSIAEGPASPSSWDLYRYQLPPGADGVHGTADDIEADPAGGELVRISGGHGGTADPNTNSDPFTASIRYLSADGRRAYFVTRGALGEAEADNSPPAGSSATNMPEGTAATTATRNLYLYDEDREGKGRWKFVARLPYDKEGDSIEGCASSLPIPRSGGLIGFSLASKDVPEARPGNCVRGTLDGSTVAFLTTARLTEDDTDAAADIYLYDAAADELVRVSAPPIDQQPYVCDADGKTHEVLSRCNADLGSGAVEDRALGLAGLAHYNLAVERGGEVSLFFESRLALVSEDTNGDHWDVYRWRAGKLDLISTGDTANHSWYSGNSLDGEDVFVQTTQRIDPREIEDSDLDIYDARVGGGFPPPTPPPVACDVLGGGCAPAPAPGPAAAPIASSALRGAGNLAAKPPRARRCAGPGRRAAKLVSRAKRLRKAARRARAPRKGRRLRRRATVNAKRAKRASKRAKRCRARAKRRAR